jgi:hypothetical protein
MAKSTVTQKRRKPGRPATGHDPVMTARVPETFKARFTAWAKSKGMARSEALRQLIEQALAAAPKRGRKG